MPSFYLGVQEELEKSSFVKEASFNIDSMPMNENILPNINKQTKWKYVRTKDGLKLSDGNLVYSFGGLPEELPSEDSRVSRHEDDNILNLHKDHISSGTAQIHRSSPDNIYMTLADGQHNPTFMLQHEQGKNWRYTPSKKFVQKLQAMNSKLSPATEKDVEKKEYGDSTLLDAASLFAGGKDHLKTAFELDNPYSGAGLLDATGALNLGASGIQGIKNLLAGVAANPVSSIAAGMVANEGLGKVRDVLNPRRVIERANDPSKEKSLLHSFAATALPVAGIMALHS
jgi:hypothetical protein